MERYRVGDIFLDADSHYVEVCGEQVILTKKEFEILRCLLKSGGEPVSMWTLASYAYGIEPIDQRTIKVHICNMRKKIGRFRVLSVYGMGYMVNPSRTVTVPEPCSAPIGVVCMRGAGGA